MEADPVTAAKVIETLSTASPSVGWVAMILSSASYWAVRMLPEESSRAIFSADLSGGIQPTVLAGTLVPHGRAVRVEGGWRVSGQWPFASGCHHAHWLPSASWLYSEENGENSPILDANGAPEWRVFHVPAARCVILDTWHTTGLRGTGSHDYTMEDVFVTGAFVRRHSLREAATLPGPQYAYAAFAVPALSAVALGAARGAVDALVELFGSKTDRRSGRPGGRAGSTSRPTWAPPRRWPVPLAPTCMTRRAGCGSEFRPARKSRKSSGLASGWPAPMRCRPRSKP